MANIEIEPSETEMEVMEESLNNIRKKCIENISEWVSENFVYDKLRITSSFGQPDDHKLVFTFTVNGIIT